MTTAAHEGINLLGSEMLTWSDLHSDAGGFGGLVVPHLLGEFSGNRGKVLVAGPATVQVIEDLARQFGAAEVLTRSWLDAQELHSQLGATVTVHCGPLDRLVRPDDGYDAVVAVAGLERLHSAEEDTPSWEAVLGQLAALLGESGELYVALDNPVGVERLVALPEERRRHDAAWPQGRAHAATPGDATVVLDLLSNQHGLSLVESWCCHGPRQAPRIAASSRVFEELRSDSVLARVVAGAYREPNAQTPSLRSVPGVAGDLVRAGLGAATAPLSVLHVRRGGPNASAETLVLLGQENHEDGDGVVPVAYRLERAGSGWTQTLLVPQQTFRVAPGLTRDLGLLEGDLPGGRLLGESLADLLAEHDVSGAGVLIRRLRDWLGPEPHSAVSPAMVPVVADRVVLGSDSLDLVDRSFVAASEAERDTVLLRVLLCFAQDLLGSAGRHPWSNAATPKDVASSLAAAAGIEVGDPLYQRAVALDLTLRTASERPADFEAPLGGAIAAMPYADLLDLTEGLAARAAQGDAHVVWLLHAMQRRQRAIRRTRAKLRNVTNSREYRLGRRVFWVRDGLRRRRERREAMRRGPLGEWREPSGEAKDSDEPLVVEEHLLPPGYLPKQGVEVVPSEPDWED